MAPLAVAVVPHPPAVLPQVGVGLPEMEPVRAAIRDAVATLLASGPERVVVVGPADPPVLADERAGGTFGRFGVDLAVGGPDTVLPASFAVGAWLLDRAGWTGPRLYSSTRPELRAHDAVLVLADADTAAGVTAPTHGDPRAAAVADVVAEALAVGDAKVLADLDPLEAAQWEGTGVAPLQVLGRLCADVPKGAVTARLLCDEAPFGVRYWVAEWRLTP